MTRRPLLLLPLLLLLALASAARAMPEHATPLQPKPEHSFSAVLTTKFIEQFHYNKKKLDDAQSADILEHYIEALDPNRSIFIQSDIDSFKRFEKRLDDTLRAGDLTPAFEIFQVFNERRLERARYALKRLEQPFDFTIDEEYRFDRSEAPWPKDRAELDEIWRKRIKNDVLSLRLAGKSEEKIKETLRKRYERMAARSDQFKPEDVYALFINAYLATVEPHTSYFSPRASENFKINMSLSLEGIGAVLRTEEDYTVVQKIIKGGPADLGGQLHAEDRIIGVGQGEKGEIEDVVGWRLDDVVALIRGPKDSVVRLQILPHGSGLEGPPKVITIVRDKIKLEEQQAQKSIIEIEEDGKRYRIGVVTIPTFYMDFDAYARGDENYRSTTRDTEALIRELEKEGIDGLVIDLRGNGGGSLPEAIALTGLFIERGPVVQIKNSQGELRQERDEDKRVAYDGPLAVLVDRFSASASEIFAGAIKDYHRGIIIGEPTFGKGTVQTIVDLNRYIPEPHPTLGQLKLTMAQFFRVNGDSTQHRGVVPDILFPTADNSHEHGERSLENALPWARIEAAKYRRVTPNPEPDLPFLRQRSAERIARDSGFEFLLAQAEERDKAMKKESVTLLESRRKAEREQQEQAQRQRINELRRAFGMEPLKEEEIEDNDSAATSAKDEKFKEKVREIELREAAAILVDLIRQPGRSLVADRAAAP